MTVDPALFDRLAAQMNALEGRRGQAKSQFEIARRRLEEADQLYQGKRAELRQYVEQCAGGKIT